MLILRRILVKRISWRLQLGNLVKNLKSFNVKLLRLIIQRKWSQDRQEGNKVLNSAQLNCGHQMKLNINYTNEDYDLP